MTISATEVRFDEDAMWVGLSDCRTLGVPVAWFPRLLGASAAELAAVQITAQGLHWEALNEDVWAIGLLEGRRRAEVA